MNVVVVYTPSPPDNDHVREGTALVASDVILRRFEREHTLNLRMMTKVLKKREAQAEPFRIVENNVGS